MWFPTQQKKEILLLTDDAPTIHILLFSFMLLQMKKWNHIVQEHFAVWMYCRKCLAMKKLSILK